MDGGICKDEGGATPADDEPHVVPSGVAAAPPAVAAAAPARAADEPVEPPSPADAVASPAEVAAPVDAAAAVACVLQQLAAPDAAAQLAGAEAATALCAGKRDAPDDPAACKALLKQGGVPALLRLGNMNETAAGATAEVRAAALGALAALTDVLVDARDAVVSAGGLPVLAAAVTHEGDDRVANGAAHVLWYTSRGKAHNEPFRTSGALDAVMRVVRRASVRSDGGVLPVENKMIVAALYALGNSCVGCPANLTATCNSGVLPCLVELLQPGTAVEIITCVAAELARLCFNDATVLAAARDAGAAAALRALLPPTSGWAATFEEVVSALQIIDLPSVALCVPKVVEQLTAPDAAAQLEACKAVATLCSGKTDQPDDPASCTALVAHGVVLTLLRFADTGAAELRCAALDSLGWVLDILPAQRAAVADAGGLPLLAAAITRGNNSAEAVHNAVRVLWFMTDVPAERKDAMRTSGALDALLSIVRRAAVPAAGEPPADYLVVDVLKALLCACSDCVANSAAICDSGALPSLVALLQPATPAEVLKETARLLRLVCVVGNDATTAAVRDAGAEAALRALLPPASGWAAVLDHVLPALMALDPSSAGAGVKQLLELLESADADAMSAASRAVESLSAAAGDVAPIGTPLDPAACAALTEHGIVPALLRVSIDEHAPDVRRAALAALIALVRVSTSAEAALAASGAALAALVDAVRTAVPHHLAVLRLFQTTALTQRGKAVLRKVGAIPAVVSQMPSADAAKDCCSALWSLAEDCPKNAEQVRACGGITELLAVVARNNTPVGLNSETVECAVGALMTLANHDALHAVFLAHDVLRRVAPVIRSTVNASTRLQGLLFIACVYSGRSDADALLSEFDVTEHLRGMLIAVQGGRPGLYLNARWSVRETALYARNMAVDSSRATRLAVLGVLTLLVTLLRATDDAAAQQHVCRALCNFAYVDGLLPKLHAAGVAAAVQPFAASADGMTADAAKGVLLALGELRDTSAQVASDKAESGAAAVSDVRAAGGALAAAAPHFDVFLSHKRTDAKDFARGLYTLLVLRGHTAFLDFEYREQLNDLDQVVAACDNLVFILTDNVFESPWCMLELAAAARAGVNIILVRKEGARWLDATGQRTAEHPPAFLIEQLDEVVRQPLFSSKAIAHSDEYYKAFCDTLISRLATPEAAAANRARAAAAQSLGAAQRAPAGVVHSAGAAAPPSPLPAHQDSAGDHHGSSPHTPAVLQRTPSHPPLPATPATPQPPPSAGWEHAQLHAEVAHLREALADARRELSDLHRVVGGGKDASGGAHHALVLPLAAMSIVSVTCCVAMLLMSGHAAAGRRA